MLVRRSLSRVRRAAVTLGLIVGGPLGIGPRLPPGFLGKSGIAKYGDDRFYLNRLRRYGPIFKVIWSQNLTICIVGFERARHLFAVHARALLPMTIEIESFVPFGFMRRMPPDAHSRYRALFVSALQPDLTVTWEGELRHIIRGELQRLASVERTSRDGATQPLTATLDVIALGALVTMFFGVKPGDHTYPAIEAAFQRMGPKEFVYPLGDEQRAGFEMLRSLVHGAIRTDGSEASWASANGLLGRIIAKDRALVDETVIGNLIYMVEMGRYDVRSLMRWVLKYLSDAPDAQAQLRQALDGRAVGEECAFAEAVVLETLRLDQAEALNREVTSDIDFDGYRIPQGSTLRVLLRESHQDESTFSEPERFTPCRFSGKTYSSRAYAPFGVGEHRCIAAQLVVRVCQLLVEELASSYEWSVVGDGSRFRGRYHWEPAPTFDIALVRRPATHS